MTGSVLSDSHGDVIRSFDGTLIATRCAGDGSASPLLIANGIGANDAIWRKVTVDIQRHRPVLMWDHRGLLGSGPPATDRLDPGAHAEDAIAVADHYQAGKMIVASWSNGSRIALELATRYPERVAALVIVCGGSGHSMGRLLRHLELASLLPPAMGVLKHFGASLQAPFRALVARPEITGLIRQSGFVGPTADGALLVEVLRGMATCDLRTLFASIEAVAGDPAPELAAQIEAPTLLIAGERDQFTPIGMVAEMHDAIRDSNLSIYERATHYLPIEYPARLSDDMRGLFDELGV